MSQILVFSFKTHENTLPMTSSVFALFGSDAVNKPSSSMTTSTLVASSLPTVAISVEVSPLLLVGVNNVISLPGIGTEIANAPILSYKNLQIRQHSRNVVYP